MKFWLFTSILFSFGPAFAFVNNPSAACKAEWQQLITNPKTEPLTNNEFYEVSDDFKQVLSPLVRKTLVEAHGFAKIRGHAMGVVYSRPAYFSIESTYKLNRYRNNNPYDRRVKGYYIATKRKTNSDDFSFQFYYTSNTGTDGGVRLLMVKARNKALERIKNFREYWVCEGYPVEAEIKVDRSSSETLMLEVYRATENNEGDYDEESLPQGFQQIGLNLGDGRDLTGEAKKIRDIVNEDAKDNFNYRVLQNHFDSRQYYYDLFSDEVYIALNQAYQIKKEGKVIGYVARIYDEAYSALIEDGAWITVWITVDREGKLKIFRQSEGTA